MPNVYLLEESNGELYDGHEKRLIGAFTTLDKRNEAITKRQAEIDESYEAKRLVIAAEDSEYLALHGEKKKRPYNGHQFFPSLNTLDMTLDAIIS